MTLPAYPPVFWVTAIVAVILVGIAKAGFGGGGAFLGTPLIALVIPVADAAALLLPLLIMIDMITLPHYRHHYHRASLVLLLIGGLLGIVVGSLLFGVFSDNERALKIAIGVLALTYVALRTTGVTEHAIFQRVGFLQPFGISMGVLAGFASTLAHAGGPPATIFLLPQKLTKEDYVGTLAILFTILNLVKLIPYQMLGLIRVGNILVIVLLAPICYLGVRLGIFLNRRFDPLWFNRIVYVLLLLAGLQLIIGQDFVRMIFA